MAGQGKLERDFQIRLGLTKFLKNFAALVFGLFVAAVILECFLRLFNPIPTRLRGSEIVLPKNMHYRITNSNSTAKLDQVIIHNKNSLGFRGPELPANFDKALSIVAVGGSTTEEYYLSDEKTWPFLLEQKLKQSHPAVWVNNAGLDGHSTYGHGILLKSYLLKLKPKYIIFLIGLNDIERSDLNPGFDNTLLKGSYLSTVDYVAEKSELANLILNIGRTLEARKKAVLHSSIDLAKMHSLESSADKGSSSLKKQAVYVAAFKKRVEDLVGATRQNGITPILMTQPVLWGDVTDPTTKTKLGDLEVKEGINARLYWQILQLYNDATRQVGRENNIKLVDLANEMPKDSLYYYDGLHYTNEGARKISEILYSDLNRYLE